MCIRVCCVCVRQWMGHCLRLQTRSRYRYVFHAPQALTSHLALECMRALRVVAVPSQTAPTIQTSPPPTRRHNAPTTHKGTPTDVHTSQAHRWKTRELVTRVMTGDDPAKATVS